MVHDEGVVAAATAVVVVMVRVTVVVRGVVTVTVTGEESPVAEAVVEAPEVEETTLD